MDQARSTISKIFNGEPHSYTRFNLTQNMEGDNSQVEMKLSSEVDEEVGGNGIGEHLNHNSNRKPYVAQKSGRTPRNLLFMAATTFLIFIIGYLIGYLVHRKKDVAAPIASCALPSEKTVSHESVAAPLMDWDDVKSLFAGKVTTNKLSSALDDFSSTSHRAGSLGDEALANKVMRRFKEYGMNTWTDEHFIKVHDPPTSSCTNNFVFKNAKQCPDGILSYSASGSVTGPVLFAYYGQENDFRLLRDRNINMNGRIILVKAGRISYAEKVANAAKMNASAVLIHPDSSVGDDTLLFGHVHLGTGDPYTPGFPSFNHTQFPPIESSGLPNILAQTITARMANGILTQLGGQTMPEEWGFTKLGGESDVITVSVNNVLTEKKINNVFGVIKGFVDPDRYVVIGAQRDAWGPGFASSTVGTSVLVELARSISDMVKNDGFKPRRTIVFASWSGGEYGSVGATEWLEGYLASLNMKAFSYINLDGIVTGRSGLRIAASPLMYTLIENALKEVKAPSKVSLLSAFGRGNWETNLLEPLNMDNAAYPFLAFSGIPSISFRFTPGASDYTFLGTNWDNQDRLRAAMSSQLPQFAESAANFAGHIVLRLVHDHLLQFDLRKYDKVIRTSVGQINMKLRAVQRALSQQFPTLTAQWLISASGSYGRAARNLASDIQNSNLDDVEMCRIINDRIMAVERNFLSPYVSARDSPFRHILLGNGPHTLKGLSTHLDAIRADHPDADTDSFRNQFALATWTLQGCANSLAGDIWSLDNEI